MQEKVLRLEPGTLNRFAQEGQIKVVTAPSGEKATGGDLAEVRQLFGEHFLGPEAVEKAFGIRINAGDVPAIPFGRDELKRAKELDHMLVLRVSRTKDGSPLTMAKMEEMLQGEFERDLKGKIFYDKNWYKDEAFFTQDVPRPGWALISGQAIPDSTLKNYFQQTEALAVYLQKDVFGERMIPRHYLEAVIELMRQRQYLGDLVSSTWQEAARKLSQLEINQLIRQSPVEVAFDLLVSFQSTGDRLLSDKFTWTSRLTPDDKLVVIGRFGPKGLGVARWEPDDTDPTLGVCFSRQY